MWYADGWYPYDATWCRSQASTESEMTEQKRWTIGDCYDIQDRWLGSVLLPLKMRREEMQRGRQLFYNLQNNIFQSGGGLFDCDIQHRGYEKSPKDNQLAK